jgi:hypothetical protein
MDSLPAQNLPPPEDSRHSMLREAMLGLLPGQASIRDDRARLQCIELPVNPPNDRLEGPHGDSLISAQCEVIAYESVDTAAKNRWTAARYRWTSVFNAENPDRGPAAQDRVTEEEVVLLEASQPGQVRPVWHERFESDEYGAWRSVTPEIGATRQGTVLFSVMTCLNGTGGCGQEFLQRHPDGRWWPVRLDWFDQLPKGFAQRILHGVRIDPRTLRAEAGFYSDHDPNCCPSQRLVVHLGLRGDSLVMLTYAVVHEPRQ